MIPSPGYWDPPTPCISDLLHISTIPAPSPAVQPKNCYFSALTRDSVGTISQAPGVTMLTDQTGSSQLHQGACSSKWNTWKSYNPACMYSNLQASQIQTDAESFDLSSVTLNHHQYTLPISTRMNMLHRRFAMMKSSGFQQKVQQLHNFYKLQTENLESERMAELATTSAMPWLQYAINGYYDFQHHLLAGRVEQSLTLVENKTIDTTQEHCQKECNINQGNTAVTTKSRKESVNKNRRKLTPKRNSSQRFMSSLNPRAVIIMNNWYERNKDYPYPSTDTCKVMAQAGNMTVEQVRKWFANKRQRSNNTRSVTEMANIKRTLRRSREAVEGNEMDVNMKRQRTDWMSVS